MLNDTHTKNSTIADKHDVTLTGFKWAIAEFLSAPIAYDLVEIIKYSANRGWDLLLDFTKLFIETTYLKKLSPFTFIVEGAAEKLHELGDKKINATIDEIVDEIDNYVDPNVHHFHRPTFHVTEEEIDVVGKIQEVSISA